MPPLFHRYRSKRQRGDLLFPASWGEGTTSSAWLLVVPHKLHPQPVRLQEQPVRLQQSVRLQDPDVAQVLCGGHRISPQQGEALGKEPWEVLEHLVAEHPGKGTIGIGDYSEHTHTHIHTFTLTHTCILISSTLGGMFGAMLNDEITHSSIWDHTVT